MKSGAPIGRRRYTLMLVPEGARGGVRQISFSLRQLRGLIAGLVLLLLLAVVGGVATIQTLTDGRANSRLVDENLALRARLAEIEGQLDEVDQELRRLRLYGTQIEDLPALPGMGPLDEDEGAIAAWLGEGSVLDEDEAALFGEFGDPMDEPGDDELLGDPVDWATSLQSRTQDTLSELRLAETEAGHLAEYAEHERAVRAAVPSTWPLHGIITSGFGYRKGPFTHHRKFHRGLDISAPIGTPVMAPAAGVVIRAEYNSGYGNMVEIDHGFGIRTRYAHNSRMLVHVGDEVERGQVISTVGVTGRTTGPHLHYEVYMDGSPVDPMEYLE